MFPLLNFAAFAGGLSRLRHLAGFDYAPGYAGFQFFFVLLQSAAFGGVFTGFGIARDFEYGFSRRLLLAAAPAQRDHRRLRDRRARALARSPPRSSPASRSSPGCRSRASGIDLVGLYMLAVLVNVAFLLWACGVAMRFQSVQAGPIMQTPVFLILFFAPVYVPLALLQGWIHGVAAANPVTRLLEAVPQPARRRADRGRRRASSSPSG